MILLEHPNSETTLRGAVVTVDVQQITGTARSVSQLLTNVRYGLDFYQREYSWEETQVSELIEDLAGRFIDQHDPDHEREHVLSYRPYFLGPIVTAQRGGVRYLVDGQQRITTLTLLLICSRRWLAETHRKEADALTSLIFSYSVGQQTFNLNVMEREDCLTAILEDRILTLAPSRSRFETSGTAIGPYLRVFRVICKARLCRFLSTGSNIE